MERFLFDWRPQHESPENTYLANKLKYHLYYRALETCFTFAKEYGKSKGMDVRCYVPTHSLVNYSQWQIVSPEAILITEENFKNKQTSENQTISDVFLLSQPSIFS